MRRHLVIAIAVLNVYTSNGREWKSSDGARTFEGQLVDYRPPHVTVCREDGRRITFSDQLLSVKDRRYCALATRVLGSSYPKVPYQVDQVLDYGMLCTELPGGNLHYIGETFIIWGNFRMKAKQGAAYKGDLYWAGSYHSTKQGHREQTIRSFAMSLDEAVNIWEYRLAPPEAAKPNNRPSAMTKEVLRSSGTGFAITTTGYIVTNAHVVEGARSIHVTIGNRKVEAKVATVDPTIDLAILKVASVTTPLRLADTTTPKLGDEITVGGFPNPDIQGTSLKLTRGVISSMRGILDDVHHYQIDAAVQPGNSGGPLLSASGEVVGIVNARLNDSAVALATGSLPQNVNYAIKVGFLLPVMKKVTGLSEVRRSTAFPPVASIGERLEQSTYLIECETSP